MERRGMEEKRMEELRKGRRRVRNGEGYPED